jgi:hypothetical protein
MKRILLLSICFALLGPALLAQAEDDAPSRPDRAAMIARVDALVAARWKELGVEPAAPASDAEFLRRAYLDLTGVIPRVSEARAFLADSRPDKRARLIDALLVSPSHATHMANTWRNIVLPTGGSDPEQLNAVVGLQNWFRTKFVENLRYDRIVSDFLQATAGDEAGPALFYTALELKPERVAADTSRIFLGLQIACAECHNHPFDSWSQKDFWGYAAFFARLQRPENSRGMTFQLKDVDRGEVKLPDTEEVVPPKYPAGASPDAGEPGTRREQLAIWMTSRDNPYLAKAAVNRVWSQLFGRGLVEPVDDLSKQNPPSHPELFDELTRYFVKTGFDIRELQRMLTGTRAYQLSSAHDAKEPPPAEAFAHMAMKTLTAEQLYDSLSRTLARGPAVMSPGQPLASDFLEPRRQTFIARMKSEARSASDYQSGIPQALTLMNGGEITEATNIERGGMLAALEAPLFSDEERVETLFLAAYSRPPTEAEREKFVAYVKYGGPTADRRAALGDVLWALLNSAEFGLNH